MAGTRVKIYWDACVYLAWLKDEKRPISGEMDGLRDVVEKLDSGEYILVASVIVKTEVLESSLTSEAAEKFQKYLKRENVTVVNVDDRVATLARDIRTYYQQQKALDHRPSIASPDALHLATAIHYGVDEFHTFDEKDKTGARGLLSLNGNVAGHRLLICKPTVPQASLFQS